MEKNHPDQSGHCRILVTADAGHTAPLIAALEGEGAELLNLPLEKVKYYLDAEQQDALSELIDRFAFVICTEAGNTRYYLDWMSENSTETVMKQKIHLVSDELIAKMLEEAGIPAIQPREGARPIDIMEFILRISHKGPTLYPCAQGSSEEMPGLLKELGMQVVEMVVCKPVSLGRTELQLKREQVARRPPDYILFHSRGSVVRTRTAFPDLDYSEMTLLSASPGVTKKMKEESLIPHRQAEGSWRSVAELIRTTIRER
ncbi:MAG: uroporphyrinogen-III synthase [Balneolaceae bacterium]